MREIRRFLIAVGYFTRIPIPAWVGWSAQELNRAARYFPAVGVAVGAICAGSLWLTSYVLPPSLGVLMSMCVSLLLTGAFHEDGLADAVDGFGGGWSREQVLAIMKDSRIGSYGASALAMALAIKFAALYELAQVSLPLAMWGLCIAHPLSRMAGVLTMARLRYVRESDDARAKPVTEGIGAVECAIAFTFGVMPLALFYLVASTGVTALTIAGTAALITLLCARYFRRRIGGYTGDCMGMQQQLAELAVYGALCARALP